MLGTGLVFAFAVALFFLFFRAFFVGMGMLHFLGLIASAIFTHIKSSCRIYDTLIDMTIEKAYHSCIMLSILRVEKIINGTLQPFLFKTTIIQVISALLKKLRYRPAFK